MSAKGFFGRVKNEIYYGKQWLKTSKNKFIHQINKYIDMSFLEYQRSIGML
jgi:hypothetical protein